MENQHRYLIQFLLQHGAVAIEKALGYCAALPEPITDIDQLKIEIGKINREITRHSLRIAFKTCEVTAQDLIILVNMKNDEISRLQIAFSVIELEYFHVLLQEILNTYNYQLPYLIVLNITSTLSGTFNRVSGQDVFERWLKLGYFVKEDEYIHLGARLIVEFTSYLKSHRPDNICKLCSELVFTAKICNNCDKMFHSYCLQKYMKTECPECNSIWTERPRTNEEVPMETEVLMEPEVQLEEHPGSVASDFDDSQPGTSTGIRHSVRLRRSNRTS